MKAYHDWNIKFDNSNQIYAVFVTLKSSLNWIKAVDDVIRYERFRNFFYFCEISTLHFLTPNIQMIPNSIDKNNENNSILNHSCQTSGTLRPL